MAGKNTAVFGIYADRSSVDRAVEALKAAGFSNNDVSALFPENQGTKDFATRRTPRRRKAQRQAPGLERCSAGGSDGWRELARWRFRASGPSSLQVRSWRHWRELALAARWAVSPAL